MEFTRGWKELLIAALGGGAVYEITDQFISRALGGLGAIAGISLKDIALILLGKYLADRMAGDWKNVFQGMALIGLYKVVYPQFVRPLVSGVVGGVVPTTPQAAHPALAAAQSYVATRRW
jgi:hypothetical protein